jgi:hypothetical protein
MSQRTYRRVVIGRALDASRLQAILARTTRGVDTASDQPSGAVRVYSVLMERDKTTVHLGGSDSGLDAMADVLKAEFTDVRVTAADPDDVRRPPTTAH